MVNVSFGRLEKRIARTCLSVMGESWWIDTPSLFVLSTGRTGTETLARVLRLSNRVLALHEPPPELLKERKEAFAGVLDDPDKFEPVFRKARATLITAAKMRRRIYAETSARLTFFAPIIGKLMPNATFIHLYRHPADVIRSGMRRGWYVGNEADPYRITPTDGEAAANWESWSQFEKICWYWAAYHEFSLRCTQSISQPVMHVRSEDLFSAETGRWRDIFSLIGVPAPAEQRVIEVLSVKHNGQSAGEFPVFENWTTDRREVLERIAGPTMRKLGLPSPLETNLSQR